MITAGGFELLLQLL